MPSVPGPRRPLPARWAAIAAISVAAVAVAGGAATRHRTNPEEKGGYGETHIAGGAFPKVLVNASSRQILSQPPTRIASLTVAGDEILTALVAPDRLVAVSRFADDPSISLAASRAPKRAARIRGVDPEGIIALEPDVVFVAHYTLDYAVRLLVGAGIPVVRFRNVRSYADVAENVELAARATGDDERGRELVQEMYRRLERVRSRVANLRRPRVLFYSPTNYTSGKDTLIDDMIRRAGGINAAAAFGLVGSDSVTLDVLLALDPDVIVVPRWSTSDAAAQDLTANPAWRDVAAIRAGRIVAVAASALTSQTPDSVLGVEELARSFHREAFAS